MDLLAWAGNVSSSVLIIFVNKVLMNTTGYGFQYGEPSLCPCIYHDVRLPVSVLSHIRLSSERPLQLAHTIRMVCRAQWCSYLHVTAFTSMPHTDRLQLMMWCCCSHYAVRSALHGVLCQHLDHTGAGRRQEGHAAICWYMTPHLTLHPRCHEFCSPAPIRKPDLSEAVAAPEH